MAADRVLQPNHNNGGMANVEMVSAQASMPPSPSALVDATLLWGDGLDMSVPTSPLAGGLDGGASVLDALVTPSRKRKRMPLTAPGSAPAAPMVQDVAPSSFLDDLGGLFGSLDAVPELALASTMALASSVYDQLDGDLGLGLGDGSSGGGMVEPGVLGGAPSSLLGLAPPSESPLPSMHPSPSVSPAAPIPPPYTVLPSESYLPRPPRLALAAATADSDDYSDDDSDDRDFESYDDESSYGDEYGSSARSRHGGGRRLAGKGKSKGKSKSKSKGKKARKSKASASASGLPPSPPSPVPNVALAATRGPLTVSQLEPESANDVMDTSADGYEYEYEVEYVYDADAEERLATPTEAVPRPPELSPIHNSPSRFEFVEEVYGVDESQVNYGVKLYEEAMRRRAAREAAVVAARAEAERSLTRDAFRPRLGPTAVSTQFQDPDFVTRLQRVSEYSQEQREALRAEVEDEVLAECTFEPRISAKSKQIMKRKEEQLAAKRAGHDPLASMLDRFNHYEAKRVDRLKELIKLREEELEVTGSPAISAYSQAIERTDSLSVHERLYAKGAEHLKLRKMKSVALADRLYEEACQPKPVVHDIAVPSIKRDYDRTRLLVRAQRSALGVHEALYHEAKARQETKRKRELRAQFEEELLHAAPKMSAKSQAIIRSKLSAESVSKLFAQADVDETGDLSRDQVDHLFVELGWFVSRSVDKHKPRIQEEQAMLDSVWTHLDPDGTGRVEPESLHAFVDSVVESDPVLSSATPADVMARVHGAADSASDSGAVLDALMEADGKLAAAFAARPEIVQFVELIRTKSAYEALHRAPKTPVLDDDCTFQPQVMVTNRTAKLEAKALARLIVKNPGLSRSPNRRQSRQSKPAPKNS